MPIAKGLYTILALCASMVSVRSASSVSVSHEYHQTSNTLLFFHHPVAPGTTLIQFKISNARLS